MEGHAMQQAQEWERTRLISFYVLAASGAKVKRPSDILKIPLIDEVEVIDKEEVARKFREQAAKVEALMKAGNGVKPTKRDGSVQIFRRVLRIQHTLNEN